MPIHLVGQMQQFWVLREEENEGVNGGIALDRKYVRLSKRIHSPANTRS